MRYDDVRVGMKVKIVRCNTIAGATKECNVCTRPCAFKFAAAMVMSKLGFDSAHELKLAKLAAYDKIYRFAYAFEPINTAKDERIRRMT